jgi:hypothetical protein
VAEWLVELLEQGLAVVLLPVPERALGQEPVEV